MTAGPSKEAASSDAAFHVAAEVFLDGLTRLWSPRHPETVMTRRANAVAGETLREAKAAICLGLD